MAATAGPAIASLTGNYFPANERGRVYAYIRAARSPGNGCGLYRQRLGGQPDRLAGFVHPPGHPRLLPGSGALADGARAAPRRAEPAGAGRGRPVQAVDAARRRAHARRHDPDDQAEEAHEDELAREAAERLGARPNPRLVLTEDPQHMGLIQAVKYLLSIPSNVLMIVGSSLGYFFFSGLQTFVLKFVVSHYGVGQATAELALALLVGGALVGTLVSGVTDMMLRRGNLSARVVVPAVCYLAAAALPDPGLRVQQPHPRAVV